MLDVDFVVRDEVFALLGASCCGKIPEHDGCGKYFVRGGQQQRVSFARVLTSHAEILLLDEPFLELTVKNIPDDLKFVGIRARGLENRADLGFTERARFIFWA